MNIKSLEKKEKSTVELTVEVSPETFEQAINKVYHKKKGGISVPGFRKGKVPRKIIEGMYGIGVFYEDAFEILSNDAYRFGVEQEGLNVVGRPAVHDIDLSDDKVVTIVFILSVYPEVEMGQYKGLLAPKAAVEIGSQEIDAKIASKRQESARIVKAERKSQMGDTVTIDFEGFVDGVPFEGGKGEDFELELGSGQFIPGFEDQLVGADAGEERDISVTFPEDYSPELAGKNAVFKVLVHEIKEIILPELDDEFAKDVSEFETLEEYRADIGEKLCTQKENEAEQNFQEAIITQVAENMKAEIPDVMIEEQLDRYVDDFSRNVENYGIKFDQYLSMMGLDAEGFRKSSIRHAEKQVKISLALAKIVELEDIQATEDELAERYQSLSKAYGIEVDRIKQMLSSEGVSEDVKLAKAEKLIFDTAEISETPAASEIPEVSESEEEPKADTEAETDTEVETDTEAAKPSKPAPRKKKVKKEESTAE